MKLIAKLSFAAAIVALPLSSFASTIFTDGISGTPSLTVTTVGNFTTLSNGVGQTNVDLVGPNLFADLCVVSGNDCIDLDGTNGQSEGILASNTIFTTGTYLLNFLITGSNLNSEHGERQFSTSAEVTLGDYDQTFTLGPQDSDNVSVLVNVTSSSQLIFTSLTPGDIGVTLDSASVSTVATSPIPEPSSLALLGTGALGLAGAARRRFRRS